MPTEQQAVVHIVDDDPAGRESLRYLIEATDLTTAVFADPTEFLSQFDDTAIGCVILDMRMPKTGGLEVLRKLRRRTSIPVIMVSAFAGVREAVEAIKNGATDFFEKPFNDRELLDCVQRCIRKHRDVYEVEQRRSRVASNLASLTHREREVLVGINDGKLNKQIALDLKISVKTIEHYRSSLMEKMGAHSVVELAHHDIIEQLEPAPQTSRTSQRH